MKYMNWSDLEEGDILEPTEEAKKYYGHMRWYQSFLILKNKIIRKIKLADDRNNNVDKIRIYFENYSDSTDYIFIDENGEFEGRTLFKITKVAK